MATYTLEKLWSTSDAIYLCRAIEEICPKYGCHVALTGGTLYKEGLRKDVDILFYRIRQVSSVNTGDLFTALEGIGIKIISNNGWCVKATLKGKSIDMFFPDATEGDYGDSDPESNGIGYDLCRS